MVAITDLFHAKLTRTWQGEAQEARSKGASENQWRTAHLPVLRIGWLHDLQLPSPEDWHCSQAQDAH